ncbi:MAG TPA: hypothetical protein VMO52_01975 [Acidimicrobiia bacterium]|nr:hypothetical protein [Acidimicrobiia bacterium]
MESLEKHKKILALSQMLDQWAEENLGDDPNWKPLEAVLPAEWCGGFMWMNLVVDKGVVIELYKHGITRHYLNLDADGGAHRWTGSGYEPMSLEEAIDHAFAGIEETGWDRTTVYDDEVRAEKYRALREAGWTVITTSRQDSIASEPQPEAC